MQIKQHPGIPTLERADRLGGLVVLLGEAAQGRNGPGFPYSELLRERRRAAPNPQAILITDLPNRSGARVSLGCVKRGAGAFERLTLARKLVAAQLAADRKEVGVLALGMDQEETARALEAVAAAFLAALHLMPSFKSTPAKPKRLATLHLFGADRLDLTRTRAEAEGNNLARYLTALPANQLAPRQYRGWIAALAKQHGWKMRFLDVAALEKKRAGAFLAVAQGSPEADAGIVHLRYTPSDKKEKRPALALVGKGICFDTGGVNLKPARHMHGMHQDMAGSAVALGTLLALTQLEVDFPVDCWLALAQNHVGPAAYKQGDVVTAGNGTTIEVIHTDAEGRMVLADTLALACAGKPGLLIDFATLTGSCIQALGTTYSGACANREALLDAVIRAGRDSGERVWPFPSDDDFDEALESELADVKQCTLDNEADHILAARFLGRFVDQSVPWVHIDLAAATHKGGLAHVPTEVTGFGVRFSLSLLLDGEPWQEASRERV